MAKGYWITHVTEVDVKDVEQYKLYVAAIAEPFHKYSARILVRAGQHQVVEGNSRQRHMLVEFPSYQAALDCYYSPEYQAAKKLRADLVMADVVVVEGFDGP